MRALIGLFVIIATASVFLCVGCNEDSSSSPVTPTPPDSLFVVSYSPQMGDDGVPIASRFQVVFSAHLDQSSITDSCFDISPPIPGIVNVHRDTLFFVPDSLLPYATQYQVSVKGVRASDTLILYDTLMFSFTTQAVPESWQMRLGGEYAELAGLVKAPNGDVIVAVNSRETDGGPVTPLFACLSSGGQLKWQKSDYAWTYNGIMDVDVFNDGTILVLTDCGSIEAVKLDTMGNQTWSELYIDYENLQRTSKIRARSDGGFFVATTVSDTTNYYSYGSLPSLIWVGASGDIQNTLTPESDLRTRRYGYTEAFDVAPDNSWTWATTFYALCSRPRDDWTDDAIVVQGNSWMTATGGYRDDLDDVHNGTMPCQYDLFLNVVSASWGGTLLLGTFGGSDWTVYTSGTQVIWNDTQDRGWYAAESMDGCFIMLESGVRKLDRSGSFYWTEPLDYPMSMIVVTNDNGIVGAASSPSTEGGILVTKLNHLGQFTGEEAPGELLPASRATVNDLRNNGRRERSR